MKKLFAFLITSLTAIFISACTNEPLGPAFPTETGSESIYYDIPEGIKFSEHIKYFGDELERFISVENDNVILSKEFPENRMPAISDAVIFLFKEKKHLPVIGRIKAIEKKGQNSILSFEAVDMEEVFDKFQMTPNMDGNTPLKLVVDESSEGEDADYKIVDKSVWETLEVLEANGDYEQQVTKGSNTDIQEPIDFIIQIPVSHKNFSGKIYIRIHGSVTFNGCNDADMNLSQEVGIDADFDFTAIGTQSTIWLPLFKGKKIYIYGNPFFGIAFTPNVGIFYSGKITVSSGLKLQLLNSNYNASVRNRRIVESQGKENKRNAFFKVFTLKSEGEVGLYTEAELFAFAVNPNLFSFGADIKSGISLKGEKEVGIQFPEIANFDFMVSLYPFLYVTPYVYVAQRKYSFPDKALSLRGNPFLISLLPAFAINKAKKSGNTVPVEGTYFRESFISSKDDGVALFIKGQDKPIEMKSLRSPSTKSSLINLNFSVENGKIYEVATYVDTEYDGILYDERIDIDIDIDGLCPDENHIHAIDLGLSVKWACCNVGATRPEEYGGYYAWGETREKSSYDYWGGLYRWHDKDPLGGYTKYVTDPESGIVDGRTILEPGDDVAHVKWGGNWRMPTWGEFEELYDNCNIMWTTLNGVHGMMFTSIKNGNSIFLPAAGFKFCDDFDGRGYCGGYWSSSLVKDFNSFAHRFAFESGCIIEPNFWLRYSGESVRPVSQ